MSEPVLYSFRRCPFAMRARMALDAAKVTVEHREVLLRDKPAAMLEASPKGTVPVLVLPDGQVIDESLDIMAWALSQRDPENWFSNAKDDRQNAEGFLQAFKDKLDRYKYASRYDPSVPRGAVNIAQREAAMSVLDKLAAPLSQTRFVGGDRPRLIDVATFPFVRQFAAVEPHWWEHNASTALQDWLTGWITSDRFRRIMTKHKVWQPAETE